MDERDVVRDLVAKLIEAVEASLDESAWAVSIVDAIRPAAVWVVVDASRKTPDIARHLHAESVAWCAIGDENYGEGSSREHAAMDPRFRGGKVIFARSFARIHETNLKKQGILALTFSEPATYDAIGEDDTISVGGLADLTPDVPVRCAIHKPDGTTVEFPATHTMNDEQIEWFKAGSALNIIRGKHNT